MNRPRHEGLLAGGGQAAAGSGAAGGGPGGGPAPATSLAGRELPADLARQVTNITMGQLFYILGHIQKLSAQAPVTAQALLAENPQICYALLHAECLAGMIEDPLLPMSAEELRKAKSKARQMQEELENHQLPPPALATADGGVAVILGSTAKSAGAEPPLVAPAPKHGARSLGGMGSPGGVDALLALALPPAKSPPPSPLHLGDCDLSGPSFAKSSSAAAAAAHAPTAHGGLGGGPSPHGAVAAVEASTPDGNAAPEEQKKHLLRKLVQLTPEQIGRLPEGTKMQLLQFLQNNTQQ